MAPSTFSATAPTASPAAKAKTPTSATGRSSDGPRPRGYPAREGGFTLIEILIVVVIVALMATVAVIAMPRLGASDKADELARRFTGLIDLASDEAVLNGREYGIRFEPDRYEFLVFSVDAATGQGVWTPLDDNLFRERVLPAGFSLSLTVEGQPVRLATAIAAGGATEEEAVPEPHVLLSSSGEITPFTLEIAGADGATEIVTVSAFGDIAVERDGSGS